MVGRVLMFLFFSFHHDVCLWKRRVSCCLLFLLSSTPAVAKKNTHTHTHSLLLKNEKNNSNTKICIHHIVVITIHPRPDCRKNKQTKFVVIFPLIFVVFIIIFGSFFFLLLSYPASHLTYPFYPFTVLSLSLSLPLYPGATTAHSHTHTQHPIPPPVLALVVGSSCVFVPSVYLSHTLSFLY